MIRIRYKYLSSGLHANAERSAGRTTVYLLPGLTKRERKAALRRLRQEASRDCGPALPVPQLMVALGLDRTRAAARSAAAVIRLHPAGIVVPTIVTCALMVLFVLGSVRIVHLPAGRAHAESSPAVAAGPAGASPGASAPSGGPRTGRPGVGGGAGSTGSSGERNSVTRSSPGSSGGSGLGSGTHARTATATPATGSAGVVMPASTAAGAAANSVSAGIGVGVGSLLGVSVGANAGPQPNPSPAQSPSSSGGGGGQTQICVNLGPFGGCLGL